MAHLRERLLVGVGWMGGQSDTEDNRLIKKMALPGLATQGPCVSLPSVYDTSLLHCLFTT